MRLFLKHYILRKHCSSTSAYKKKFHLSVSISVSVSVSIPGSIHVYAYCEQKVDATKSPQSGVQGREKLHSSGMAQAKQFK